MRTLRTLPEQVFDESGSYSMGKEVLDGRAGALAFYSEGSNYKKNR